MKKLFYRNIQDLQNADEEIVELGSLFERKNDQMILVDEDRYVEFPFNENLFQFAYEETVRLSS